MEIIKVTNLTKEFKVFKHNTGFLATTKQLFKRDYTIKKAVDNISFSINKGEMVGYIGPNGAGKSTTIKMITGILEPTSGEVMVRGVVPHKNRKDNAMNIGVVFGQRSQLYWDLPMLDTYELYKKMYKISDKVYKENLEFISDVLNMHDFLDSPIRQLSLGQKMRAEFSIALLHNPEILYLDEPTIGLDVLAKKHIRDILKKINKERKTTVILTTHDMDDIEEVCNRLILIDTGEIRYDGKLNSFKEKYLLDHVIEFTYDTNTLNDVVNLPNNIDITDVDYGKKEARFSSSIYTKVQVVKLLFENYDIIDLSLNEGNIEDILKNIY